jgi:colicin import membrane protein
MKVDWAISSLAHAGVLALGLVSFAAKPFDTPPESVPVDIVSTTEFSKVVAGSKNAPKAEKPKPLVEKVAEKKIAEDPTPKISEKREIQQAKAEPPPPKPPEKKEIKEAKAEPPPPLPERRPKPPPPQQAKLEPKPVDEIAEALKKDQAKRREEARKEQRKAEKEREKKEEEPRFNPDKIAALLDKRTPQRHASTGATLNSTGSLGLPNASAAQLSQSVLDALKRRISQCWNVPVGAESAQNLRVVLYVAFNPDGTVARGPEVIEGTTSRFGPAFAESGRRAILRCQPYTMLPRETYETWKDMDIILDPRDMFSR